MKKRTDLQGRDVTDLPGMWDETDVIGEEVCELCGEEVPSLEWTPDGRYLACEVCWSKVQAGFAP